MIVPNEFPVILPGQTRLAVVGDAPGPDEATVGKPFVGTAGRFLRAILASCGASTNQIFFGNVCQHLPPNNNVDNFSFEGPEIQDGLSTLRKDLQTFHPNCILLLGKIPLRTARPDLCYPTTRGYTIPLGDWRGSIFQNVSGLLDAAKCVATYHPSYVLRSYNDFPFFKFDVARAVRHASTSELRSIVRMGVLRPCLAEVLDYLYQARAGQVPQTFDIEGYPDNIGVTMLSLVPTADPTHGIVIPFHIEGRRYWTEDEEVQVWEALAHLLADSDVPKTAHNCFYELFVLAWRHRIVINNLADDTMMAHWELYPDFAKGDKEERQKVSATQKKRSLGVCASLYTEQPFYKDDRLSNNTDVKLNYNFLDSSVTAEIRNVTSGQLQRTAFSHGHYRFNISLVPSYNYIMLRGCKFDANEAKTLAGKVEQEINELNLQINRTLEERGAFHLFPVSKANEKHRARDGFNVKSPTQKRWLLYDHLKCTSLKKWGRTADEDALLHYHNRTSDPLLRLVIRCVRKRTRLSDLGKLVPDIDGRIRTSYDLVGTNTGRLSSRNSMSMVFDPTEGWVNAGTNVQNQTKDLRVCWVPDTPEHDFFQADLSGADAWTVAAELANLGHPTMLDDLLYGIKPSLVLCHMVREHEAGRDVSLVNRMDRAQLKQTCKDVKSYFDSVEGHHDASGRPLDWLYLCSKRVQHGSNYDMHAERITELVFGDSDGTIVLTKKDAELYQRLYKLRYNTDARNDWIRKTLSQTQCLVSSCGVRRQFFAIRNRGDIDDAIVREASAFNPQCNTTYITNCALRSLWYDPTNRTSRGALFVEPLLQIHDALAGQYRSRDRDFARDHIRTWFRHPLRVGNIEINIPVDAKWGPNWRDTKNSFSS